MVTNYIVSNDRGLEMNVRASVLWEDGRTTEHNLFNLPAESLAEAQELLSQDLASFMDPDEMPLTAEGWAAACVSVDVTRDCD